MYKVKQKLDSQQAFIKAVDFGPSDSTRNKASKDPYYAYLYAKHIDKSPHPQTRIGACASYKFACLYLFDVDNGLSDLYLQPSYGGVLVSTETPYCSNILSIISYYRGCDESLFFRQSNQS